MQTEQTFESDMRNVAPWWAVYTRHQHEKVVADTLTAKGFETFLPLYDSTRRWKDRSKVLSLPLFPCYVFVRGGIDRKLQVVTTPGIHMILYRGEQVAMIPDEEIAAIQKAVDGSLKVEPHPFLKCGMRVRVVRGPLEGVEGILTRKKNLLRLVLSVDMLAQAVAVEVHAWDVEPCASNPRESEHRFESNTIRPDSLSVVRPPSELDRSRCIGV
ncbi:MAG TPA: UpxY family transcription antiterminator [Terracidiphilus sp.]|nr:UpxY family transcription antiterminator [Terracidiphilus sp.]